jgi:ABC-2 type transport system permease protein
MKRFLGFVQKEFYHIFRDYRTMIILFGMPVAQILLFGYAITTEIKYAKIAILDKSNDHVTTELKDKILSSGYFLLSDNLQSESQIKSIFKKGEVKEVIVFETGFAEKLQRDKTASIQILADATDPNTANTLVNYTQGIIGDYQRQLMAGNSIPYSITPEIRMFYNPDLKGAYMFVPGVMAIILMLISAMMTSISITREKELGTMEVLMVSPLKPYIIIIGKVIPYIILSFINALIILTLGVFVFGVPINGSLLLLLAESILFIITTLSLGILISTVVDKQQNAMLISMAGLMLPTIILSGFIFPINNMPWVLRIISNIIPAKWFIIIIRGIMLKGIGIRYLWEETLILTSLTLVFIGISIKQYKIRLE